MVRPLRIEYPGAIYHVTSRGNAQGNIFLDDADRDMFLDALAGAINRFGWVCHAFCLMGNHYHLVIETPMPNMSAGMRQLNGVYTQRLNRRHRRVGHVFQGRYKAILVERDAYLLELCRYVVLNPVRAGMVSDVSQWAWSSYHATAGLQGKPQWLSIDWLLSQFGNQRGRCVERYIQFVADGVNRSSVWNDLNQQIYLGREGFIDRIKSEFIQPADLTEIPKEQWRQRSKSLHEYADEHDARNTAMGYAYLEGGHKMNAIAKHFGVHYTTVSRAVKKLEQQIHDCKT